MWVRNEDSLDLSELDDNVAADLCDDRVQLCWLALILRDELFSSQLEGDKESRSCRWDVDLALYLK